MKHPLAFKSIKSFLSTTSVLLVVFALGCTAPEQITVDGDTGADAKPLEKLDYTLEVEDEGDLGLWKGDQAVYVGDTVQESLQVFEPPNKSYSVASLPDGFGEDFTANGWDMRGHSFSCILYKGKTVLALYTQDEISEEEITVALADVVQQYRGEYGPPQDSHLGTRIEYYFWFTDDRALMINTAVDANDSFSLTVAVGVPEVMEHLRMDRTFAEEDKAEALRSLTQQRSEE